ncbi:carbon-nitrogen hydrolase [Lentinula edodes]|uniref:carbon-nitrogen hydrolase n=1 Tax=Lentinula edodes TaxID=5353 RepID=UPI001E8EDF52|nr:carbon-nitrogen hydrolase [Lentinula edodes]KAH7876082.1 carbon-nitrogen hydrolase [Lentinula edodes]KAJ3907978.1 carbon-nitrogen hydrolase [Lentinula edodes]KAJ3916932.1 carbon-nitrogen hydrolase [Lentinula edodes]
MTSHIPLRIAVVQFSPKIGQVQVNVARARELCRQLKPRSIDLVCLPEMIMSGYNFQDAQAISPYLEHPKKGPTSQFCSELAGRLKCYVFAGYPEKLTDEEAPLSKEESTSEAGNSQTVGANSAVLYGPNGEWVGHYRKTNLFVTDKSWAKPGTGFATFLLPSPLRTLSFGICNDLNVSDSDIWTPEDGPYEIADYALSQNANILVLLNAWLDSGKEEFEDTDWDTLNYWAARLRPLWVNNLAGPNTNEIVEEDNENANGKEMIVVVCNRTGEENGKTFAGSSAIYSMRQGYGRPKLLDMMGRKEEGVRVWNILV